MALTLVSPAFGDEEEIPDLYTCDGEDLSPELYWIGAPEGVQSYAVICDDSDAPMGTWDHWLIFNLPANVTALPEGLRVLPSGARGGQNSWGRSEYGGPCPPDQRHRYSFRLYALDTLLDLPEGATKEEIMFAMSGHILEEAELIGSYDRAERR